MHSYYLFKLIITNNIHTLYSHAHVNTHAKHIIILIIITKCRLNFVIRIHFLFLHEFINSYQKISYQCKYLQYYILSLQEMFTIHSSANRIHQIIKKNLKSCINISNKNL